MSFCAKCGTQLGDGTRFCSSCGEAVYAAATAVQAQPEAQKQAPIVTDSPLAQRALAAGEEIQRMGDTYEKVMEKYEEYAKPPLKWKECTWRYLKQKSSDLRGGITGVLSGLMGVGSVLGIVIAFAPAPIVLRILAPLAGIALFVLNILTLRLTNIGLPDTFKLKKALETGVLTQGEYDLINPWSNKGLLGQISESYKSEFSPAYKAFSRAAVTPYDRALLENLSLLDDFITVFYLRKATKEMRVERAEKLGRALAMTAGAALAFTFPITSIALSVMRHRD